MTVSGWGAFRERDNHLIMASADEYEVKHAATDYERQHRTDCYVAPVQITVSEYGQ